MPSRRAFLGVLPAVAGFHLRSAGAVDVPGVIDVRAHGARGDGSGDDGPAIRAAIAACRVAGGGVVFLPTGQYPITESLRIPAQVRVVGTGSRTSIIRAAAGFPAETPVIRIGDGQEYAFSCGLEQLQVECGHIYGSTGIFSSDLQENGCISGVVVNSYHRYGIHLDGDQGQGISNFYLENLELLASSGTRGATGILVNSGSWKNRIENVSIVPHGQDGLQGTGIRVRHGKLDAHGVHVEYHQEGVVFEEGSHGSLSDVDGEHVDVLVGIRTAGRVLILFAFRSHGSAIVANEASTHVLTDGALSFYAQEGPGQVLSTTAHAVSNLGPLRVAGGAAVLRHLSMSEPWGPPRIRDGGFAATVLSVTGARPGDTTAASYTRALPAGALLSSAVTGEGIVTVTLANLTGKPLEVAPGAVRVDVWGH